MTSITAASALPEETTTTYAYDPVTCNVTSVTDALLNTTIYGYDPAGNVVSAIDAEMRETRFVYDARGHVVKSIDATNTDPDPACGAAGVTCYAYDEAGNLTDLTDANGNVTSYVYDTMDRVVTRTDPLFVDDTFTYDPNGNLEFVTDRNGQAIEYQYDDVNRVVAKIMQPGQPEEVIRTFGYDPNGNLASVIDPDATLTLTYDLLNRLVSADTTGSPAQPAVVLDTTYDANGNRATLDDAVGQTVYLYDVLDRLTDLTPPGQATILLDYDPLSRLAERTLPNGTTAGFIYDVASRLTDVTHDLGASPISAFAYGHDDVGNRTSLTQTRTALTVAAPQTFDYDELYRVADATHPVAGTETFAYDPVGNRTTSYISTSHVYDAANRLIEDELFCYAYDSNGNQTARTAKVGGACTGAVTTFSWDVENRLVQVDLPGGSVARYRYDGLGRRVEKDVDGAVTRYVYDGPNILLEYDGANVLQARYTHGAGVDDPLVMERDLDAGGTFGAAERFVYHADGLGSITELTDVNGSVVRAYAYDAYGRIAADTGTLANPYAFTGREYDAETGLYFYRARIYDSASGRFLSEDPTDFAGGDVNLYRYASGNPINATDPTGRFLAPNPGTAAGAAAGTAVLPGPGTAAGAIVGTAIFTAATYLVLDHFTDDDWGGGDDPPCDGDDGWERDECDRLYEDVDIPVCRGIARRRGAAAAQRCYATAAVRYGECIKHGYPITPLDTWNN